MRCFRLRGSLLCLALAIAPGRPNEQQHSGPTQDGFTPDLVFVQASMVSAAEAPARRFPEGSRLVRLSGQQITVLTSDFFAAADPHVSPDAARILFSGQKTAGSTWQIWEIRADGSGIRQVTHCSGDCFKAAYLPPDQIIFTASSGHAYAAQAADGSGAHPVTFGPGNFVVETVLQDGRVLLSADSPLAGGGAAPSRVLYTMRPDGTGLASFRWGLTPGWIYGGADQLDDGTVVFVKRKAAARTTGGDVAWIRPGEPHNAMITPAGLTCWSAHQLGVGRSVVVAGSSRDKFDLYAFDPSTGTPSRLLYRDAQYSSIDAVPLAPRPAPRAYWSILRPERASGRFICLDSRVGLSARAADAASRVRVIAQEADGKQERTLGEAPVETDGSFYVEVPADRPLRFELVGAGGEVVQAQRSWVWVRPGEDRGCVGCHEDRARAPENRWPLALKRLDTPISIGLPGSGTR